MGNRLVAYEREDGHYTHHETEDGIDLRTFARQPTFDTPFGGPDWHNLWAKMAIKALRWDDTDQLEHLFDQDERPIMAVRPEPAHWGASTSSEPNASTTGTSAACSSSARTKR